MLTKISWSSYIITVTALLLFWYLIVGFPLYFPILRQIILGKSPLRFPILRDKITRESANVVTHLNDTESLSSSSASKSLRNSSEIETKLID